MVCINANVSHDVSRTLGNVNYEEVTKYVNFIAKVDQSAAHGIKYK